MEVDIINTKNQYQQGQRWGFKDGIAEFETTLVIGNVREAHPEWGWNERVFEVYVQYSPVAKESIPEDYDGTILALTEEGLNNSVTTLIETGIELPWWWVYGRRFHSPEQAPNGRGTMQCDRVSEVLPHIFKSSQQILVEARARAESLRKHRLLFGPGNQPRKPSQSVAESWQRIISWMTRYAPSMGFPLNGGATEAAIAEFEKAIEAKLPDDFKESLRIHDGGNCWIPYNRGEFLSLDGILGQWKMYSEWQAKGEYANGGSDWIPRDIVGPIKPIFWNKQRIPITDNSGDHLTLDLDPPPEGTYGQIISHSHEVGPQEVVAPGWADFMRMLVDDLESGKFVYLEYDNTLELLEELEKRA